MAELECIIHYEIKDCKYSKVKPLSDVNKEQIKAAKQLREKLGGANFHEQQCKSIPGEVDPEIHGVHLEPCYKKFTLILSKAAGATNVSDVADTNVRPKRMKISGSTNSRGIYPKECFFCKKNKIKRKQQHSFPITITTRKAEYTLKQAAKENEDQSVFMEINDIDLIAKEFRYHESCYRNFTRKRKISVPQSSNEEDPSKYAPRGDFDAVSKYIEEKILQGNQAVSMKVLHEIFGLHVDDRRYRWKLKTRIEAAFTDKLYFLTVSNNTPEIVVNAKAIDEHTIFNDRDHIIKQAAEYLRDDIIQFASETEELSWPLNLEDVTAEARRAPNSLSQFMQCLLKNKDQPNREKIDLLINSYTADLIHGVTRGRFITAKHFLLGLGLHSLTGQKKPIRILSHLGHCIDYNLVCEVETAEAEKSLLLAEKSCTLPLKPKSSSDIVLTFFWADNFDLNIETQTGHGALNCTHMIAFQEETARARVDATPVTFERKRNRALEHTEKPRANQIVDPRKEPPLMEKTTEKQNIPKEMSSLQSYLFWIVIRKLNEADQMVPAYTGWKAVVRKSSIGDIIKETVMTYLPPINAKITEFATINQYMSYLQQLAQEANMPYVNITLDVGAAINAYKFLWNFPQKFNNVIIHCGDFHFMKENFGVIGKIVKNSGFEDIIFQAEVCSTGSLNSVLAGNHYNRAWIVHSAFAEALERLLVNKFLSESGDKFPFPPGCVKAAEDYRSFSGDSFEGNSAFMVNYRAFKERIRRGEYGKTAQFWVCLYLDLVQNQHKIHNAVQENDFDQRLNCWKFFLPLYFALDKVNYARYGSYYVEVLKRIEQLYPGLKPLLENKGLSVQAQNRWPLRIAIDQRGEQTFNRDAKTIGGIKQFAKDSSSVLKWTLNRAEQAKNTKELLKYADVESSNNIHKSIRPSQILKSEKYVNNILQVLNNEYINPFDTSLDSEQLYNLSSGVPIPKEASDELLQMYRLGSQKHADFVKHRIERKDHAFHDSISRNNFKLFGSFSRKVVIKKDTKEKSVAVNRDILGTLVVLSARNERPIDFSKALCYPLSPVPLSLANPDGTRRATSKSKLQNAILKQCRRTLEHPRSSLPPANEVSTYVVDLMACIRTIREVPDTYEDLTWKIVQSLPTGYRRLDIIADSYNEKSLKSGERNKRGLSDRIIIQSPKSKIPRNFSEFLSNPENKQKMISLLQKVLTGDRIKALNILQCQEIYFSTLNCCLKLTPTSAINIAELESNQEEADTKIILHCNHALLAYPEKAVVVRSHSGDVDIFILLLAKIENLQRLYLDFGTGANRKGLWLWEVELHQRKRSSLLGFHAFTGNDYISAFFRKGKATCWKILQKYERFEFTFMALGSNWNLPESIFSDLEEFVCLLYGRQRKNVNDVRHKLFEAKYVNQNKIVDLSTLPPCQSALRLHILRSNIVARIWKLCHEKDIHLPDLSSHGWTHDWKIKWIENAFPLDIQDLLLLENEELEFEDNEESEEDIDDEF